MHSGALGLCGAQGGRWPLHLWPSQRWTQLRRPCAWCSGATVEQRDIPPHPQNGEHQLCSESASDGQDSAGSGGDPRSECTPLHISYAHQHPPLSPQVLTLCQALPYNFLYNLSLNLLKKFLDFSGVGHSQEVTTLNWCSFCYKNLSSHRQNSLRKRDSSLT